MASHIQIRRDSSTNWTENNPILAQGEVGWEMNTSKYKIGDGVTDWKNLAYIQFGEIPNNGKLTIQKNGTDIATFTANQSGDTTANILADNPTFSNITGEPTDNTKLATALNSKLTSSDILNVLNSTATDKALSANQGKELNDRLNNVEGRGRYLSQWNCATGLPVTQPTTSPYAYKKGDYFIVGTVATGENKNYRPDGSSYTTGTASTVEETNAVAVNDTYIYDGTVWILQSNTQKEVSFANLAGQPTDNTNLASALNAKANQDLSNLSTTGESHFLKSKGITGATKCKITYDGTGLVASGADLEATDIPSLTLSKISDVTASNTELNYVKGVTSAIQTQLNGKVSDVQVNGTSVVVSGVANVPKAASGTLGVVTINTNYGVSVNTNGQMYITAPSDTQVTAKSLSTMALTLNKIDLAVKTGVTTNTNTLTTTEQTTACNWLGASQGSVIRRWSE